MISSPPSLTSRSIPYESHIESEYLSLSPKRPFAQHEEDPLSQLEAKCRRHDVHPGAQPSRRASLDPLSPSDLENRSSQRVPLSADAAPYYHSLGLVMPASLPDLPVLHLEGPLCAGSGGVRRRRTPDAPVYAWPPPLVPTPGISRSPHGSLTGQHPPLHSSGEKNRLPRRSTLLSTWHPLDSSQTEPTTTDLVRTSESVLQPRRSRTSSIPSVHQPPEALWRSASGPTRADSSPPPGLPPRRPELRRGGSVPELVPHRSVSLSLALGSQPLRASEHTKAVLPIGAERSWVVSAVTASARVRDTGDPTSSLWSLSPMLDDREWKEEGCLMDPTSLENVQMEASYAGLSKEESERLLRHAVRNKHAPKVISPLSPLRTTSTTSVFDLSADPAYQLRMPSQSNRPSPRYAKCPPRRVRTVCDGHLSSFNLDALCTHCQECRRDTVGKRLLAFRFRQHQIQIQIHHVQRPFERHAYPPASATPRVVNEERMILANRIREMWACEMDEEEKRLWEEVNDAVRGGRVPPFARMGTACGAAAYRRAGDDGSEDGPWDSFLEMAGEGLVASLFRDVSVH